MNKLIGSILFFIVFLLLSPPFLEGAKDSCHSLEKRLLVKIREESEEDLELIMIQIGSVFSDSISQGNITRNYIMQELPNVPSSISCPILYWDTYLDFI